MIIHMNSVEMYPLPSNEYQVLQITCHDFRPWPKTIKTLVYHVVLFSTSN